MCTLSKLYLEPNSCIESKSFAAEPTVDTQAFSFHPSEPFGNKKIPAKLLKCLHCLYRAQTAAIGAPLLLMVSAAAIASMPTQ